MKQLTKHSWYLICLIDEVTPAVKPVAMEVVVHLRLGSGVVLCVVTVA